MKIVRAFLKKLFETFFCIPIGYDQRKISKSHFLNFFIFCTPDNLRKMLGVNEESQNKYVQIQSHSILLKYPT